MHTHINVGVKFKTILDISIKQNVNERKTCMIEVFTKVMKSKHHNINKPYPFL